MKQTNQKKKITNDFEKNNKDEKGTRKGKDRKKE